VLASSPFLFAESRQRFGFWKREVSDVVGRRFDFSTANYNSGFEFDQCRKRLVINGLHLLGSGFLFP